MGAFEDFCRVPGTRCNAIMARIERGEKLSDIAERYKTTTATIRVYRKALNGRLSRGSIIPLAEIKRQIKPEKHDGAQRAQVRRLRAAGLTWREIGEAMGMRENQVKGIGRYVPMGKS